jgi:amino acid transporter/mannitol/fructose-specific phosphotransferase system IIA component (Ntr-type)
MTETSAPRKRLKKDLGLVDVFAISTGAMFSSGFFLLPGLAAAMTGPSVALAYLVAGFFILPAMFSVAELATAMPKAGGAYYFLDRALGPLMGTVGGLGTWLALILKSAFALVGMGAYLGLYLDVPMKPLAVVLTAVFMLFNMVGAKETTWLQRILVFTLLLVLTFFVIQGLAFVGGEGGTGFADGRFSPLFPMGFAGFMGSVGFVFVSYAGLTKVASVAEEVRNPDRNIPLGMILSLATASFFYTVGVYIIVAVLPPDDLRSDLTPVATAAAAFFDWLPDGWGVILIVVAAVAAFASTGNAGILSSSRYPLAMARDELMPGRFARLNRFGTPGFSIIVTSLTMMAVILLVDVANIAKLASAFQLLLFALLSLAVIIMREAQIDGYDPGYRSPLYPWMQIVGVLVPFWLITEMGQLAILFTLGLVAVTLIWFFWYANARVGRSGAIFHTFARLGDRRDEGLDRELRAIVREKGLRGEDPFDSAVAAAPVLEVEERIELDELYRRAAEILEERTGVPALVILAGLRMEVKDGFLPVARGVALPHLRVQGLAHPVMLLTRARNGIAWSESPDPGMIPRLAEARAVFFLISPEEEPGLHLRLLGHLAAEVDEAGFLDRWMEASDALGLKEVLLRDDRWIQLSVGQLKGTEGWMDRPLRDLNFPSGVLVAHVRREGRGFVPDSYTVLRRGDHVTIIGEPAALQKVVPPSARAAEPPQ